MPPALRSGASIIFIGEIRDDNTAHELVLASINRHFVSSAIHTGSITQAIARMQSLCAAKAGNADTILAEGLVMVIWQPLTTVTAAAGGDGPARHILQMKTEVLSVRPYDGVKAKIPDGRLGTLKEDVAQQGSQLTWMAQEDIRRRGERS